MAQTSKSPSLALPALILGASVVTAGLLVKITLDRVVVELSGLRTILGSQSIAGQAGPSRPGRPDPNERYVVDTGSAPTRGPGSAEVTIVEFTDFECPFCASAVSTLDRIEEEYGERVRIVFKHLPLAAIHPNAPRAHAAAEAAHRQGKFWEMHDLIFANREEKTSDQYLIYALEIGLSTEQFTADMKSSDVKERIDEDAKQAAALGVTGTPAFFVNGRFLSGAHPFESFQGLIEEDLAIVEN